MKIEASWSDPIPLKKSKVLIYDLDLELLPRAPGVYVFGRTHGENVFPIYVGRTKSVRGRIANHLKSLPLMRAMQNAPNGKRFLIFCLVKAKAVKKAEKHIEVLEKALIIHTQSEGHTLFNTQGTKRPTDTLSFTGNRTSEAIAPRVMLIKRALTKSSKKKG